MKSCLMPFTKAPEAGVESMVQSEIQSTAAQLTTPVPMLVEAEEGEVVALSAEELEQWSTLYRRKTYRVFNFKLARVNFFNARIRPTVQQWATFIKRAQNAKAISISGASSGSLSIKLSDNTFLDLERVMAAVNQLLDTAEPTQFSIGQLHSCLALDSGLDFLELERFCDDLAADKKLVRVVSRSGLKSYKLS